MKTILIITASIFALATQGFSQNDPNIPVGTLNINLATVREGVAPDLSWEIEYPNEIDDVICIDDPEEEVTCKRRLRVQVCVIGVGITDQNGTEYPARSYIFYSGSGWQHIFTGTGSQVNPWIYYDDRIVQSGSTISFGAKVQLNGYPYYYNDSRNVVVLKNGDYPPSNAAGYNHQTSASDYLQPYIQNGKLALGPLDIIYCAELTHSDESHYGFDLQDTIILLRFTKVD